MLVAAAVCPHPPLLVPQVAGGAAAELDRLRAACAEAVRSLVEAGPDVLVVTGGDGSPASFPGDAAGSLRPWGPDVRVGPAGGEPVLPLSLTIGRWLLENAAGAPEGRLPLRFEAVAADAPTAECAALGRRLADSAGRVALLVMGDGSARRVEKSPGYVHPDAVPYDDLLAAALGAGDSGALLALDPARAAELWVAGRAAFQVLAGAAHGAPPPAAELLREDAPYGVGYFVARWLW
ncbi:class III extradiol dioxygenase subunit B-like domain-containing protein [Microbispora sp. H10670]|uniref:class III extradiol dioxygenase subunit B-like domain-containing protein n=1 Tax=Microbispora sp. H10670 TaxID=2729108 RepID=UPI001603C0D9|nr:class III extradiol dioxygenase subunit B-like domain-containing protein [Microbispora sp. H10670]